MPACRAGRDGQPSESLVYASREDLETLKNLEKGVRQGSIQEVAEYALQPGCRCASGKIMLIHCSALAFAMSIMFECSHNVSAVLLYASQGKQLNDAMCHYILAYCRRKRMVNYFGEQRGSCNASGDLPCDYCRCPSSVNKLLHSWQEYHSNKDSAKNNARQQPAAGKPNLLIPHVLTLS